MLKRYGHDNVWSLHYVGKEAELLGCQEILFADEPTGNLDSKTSYDIMGLLDKIHEDGNTVIVVEHDEETIRAADQILVIRGGAIGDFILTLPVLTALQITEQIVPNRMVKDAIAKTRDAVTDGKSLALPLAQSKIFPQLMIDLIKIGEETGDVPGALKNVAETYENELSIALRVMTNLIEPALIIVMADGLVWSELGAAMPGSGGSYRYLREGFGRERWGRLVAFLFIWQFILSGPLEIASGYIGFARYLRAAA